MLSPEKTTWSQGVHSLIWPKWVCAAKQVIVFGVLSLSLLSQGVFLDRKPLK